MLKKLKYGLIMVLTIICVSHWVPINHVDKELKPYYDDYMFLANSFCTPEQYWYPSKVRIYLTDLQGQTIGTCAYRYPSAFDIMIDRTFFKAVDDVKRFQLLAHEMRHCLFVVDHNPDPNNYMAEYFPSIPKFILYRQVIDDLKKSCGGK